MANLKGVNSPHPKPKCTKRPKKSKKPPGSYGVLRVQLSLTGPQRHLLEYLASQSAKLYNQGMFYARQTLFKAGQLLGRFDLLGADGVANSPHFAALPAQTAQQTLLSVAEAWKGWVEARKTYAQTPELFTGPPRIPGYLEGGLYKLAFPGSSAGKPVVIRGVEKDQLRFPIGAKNKVWFDLDGLLIDLPGGIDVRDVREFTLVPQLGGWTLEMSYLKPDRRVANLDRMQALGIDLGTATNLAACVGTDGSNLLVDARQLKSANQGYNRALGKRQSYLASVKRGESDADRERAFTRERAVRAWHDAERARMNLSRRAYRAYLAQMPSVALPPLPSRRENAVHWDERCNQITRKRNNQMRDGINKAAQLVVQHALSRGLGMIVVGWNSGIKNRANLGGGNQNFVGLPVARLKTRIGELCVEYGLGFAEQEESYTSVSSFLGGDTLPVYVQGRDPRAHGWAPSGTRVQRGLYRTACGSFVNADLNGAANILSKWRQVTTKAMEAAGETVPPFEWSRVVRRSLTTAGRVRVWPVMATHGHGPASTRKNPTA